jgi:hypothetical protein
MSRGLAHWDIGLMDAIRILLQHLHSSIRQLVAWHHKARDIGDNGIVEEVHGFASADKSVLPQPWRRAKQAYPRNGFKNPSFQWLDSLAQKDKQDIGDKKIDEEVHGFVNRDRSIHPTPLAREEHTNNGELNPQF